MPIALHAAASWKPELQLADEAKPDAVGPPKDSKMLGERVAESY